MSNGERVMSKPELTLYNDGTCEQYAEDGDRADFLFPDGHSYICIDGALYRMDHIKWLMEKGEWPPGVTAGKAAS